jgi:hypothetical protein
MPEVELQYTPDVTTFFECNQNASINLNERALNKNRSLNNIQKNAIRQLVQDINQYSNADSLSATEQVVANDKYRKLVNLTGLYEIKDYILTGEAKTGVLKSTGLTVSGSMGIEGVDEVKEDEGSDEKDKIETYSSNLPGCPRENDLRQGKVPKVWLNPEGQEFEESLERDWVYDQEANQWKGIFSDTDIIFRQREEVPEWEIFIPADRVIKSIPNTVALQIPMGGKGWENNLRGRQRRSGGYDGYQARVGTTQ